MNVPSQLILEGALAVAFLIGFPTIGMFFVGLGTASGALLAFKLFKR